MERTSEFRCKPMPSELIAKSITSMDCNKCFVMSLMLILDGIILLGTIYELQLPKLLCSLSNPNHILDFLKHVFKEDMLFAYFECFVWIIVISTNDYYY